MKKLKVRYIARSENKKTGNIAQQYIGEDRKDSKLTCHDSDGTPCPLLEKLCYAHNGTVGRFGFYATANGEKNGKDYSLDNALINRHKSSKFVRLGAIGDPAAIDPERYDADVEKIRKAGLGVLSYTHFPFGKGKHLRGKALASCDTSEQAKDAINAGWRTALHVRDVDKPQGETEDGHNYTLCPAQRGIKMLGKNNDRNRRANPHYNPKYEKVSCNTCGLCDPERKGLDIVIFLEH